MMKSPLSSMGRMFALALFLVACDNQDAGQESNSSEGSTTMSESDQVTGSDGGLVTVTDGCFVCGDVVREVRRAVTEKFDKSTQGGEFSLHPQTFLLPWMRQVPVLLARVTVRLMDGALGVVIKGDGDEFHHLPPVHVA